MVDSIRGAMPEEAEYYRELYLDGYSKGLRFSSVKIREAVNGSGTDEDINLKSEYWSVFNKNDEVRDIWEKTFLIATLRHQETKEKRHESFCRVAAKITRIMIEEGLLIKHPA